MALPKRLAHRGASAVAPENTLAALERAAQLGATWVEFDVQLTRDHKVIVIHDWRLERTTDGGGAVACQSLAYIRSLSAGAWFSPVYIDERVPLFSEWLALAIKLGLNLNIELKARGKQQAMALARQVSVVMAREQGLAEIACLLSSSESHCLTAISQYAPDFQRALIVDRVNAKTIQQACGLDCVAINPNAAYLSTKTLAATKQAGLGVIAWTVNNTKAIKALYDMGVDGVFSDVVVS